jgi:hypothetical protein
MAGIGNPAPRSTSALERKPGTLERTQHACKRLVELRDRLKDVNSNLHGPRPQGENEKAPAPNSLTSYVDSVHYLLDDCEKEVQEIYESLGIA